MRDTLVEDEFAEDNSFDDDFSSTVEDFEELEAMDEEVQARYLTKLQGNAQTRFHMKTSSVMNIVLENSGVFCQVLAASQGLTIVTLGVEHDNDEHAMLVGTLEITEDRPAAWNHFCRAIHNLDTVEEFILGSGLLDNGTTIQMLQNALHCQRESPRAHRMSGPHWSRNGRLGARHFD